MSFKKSDKVLIIFKDNWADEMDIEGSKIMPKKDWERYINIAEQCFNDMHHPKKRKGNVENYWDDYDRISFLIGSNEEIEYEDFKQFEHCFTVYDLTTEEANILTQFHFDDFGFFPDWIFDEWAAWNNIEF